jgi:hypothetical protein
MVDRTIRNSDSKTHLFPLFKSNKYRKYEVLKVAGFLWKERGSLSICCVRRKQFGQGINYTIGLETLNCKVYYVQNMICLLASN